MKRASKFPAGRSAGWIRCMQIEKFISGKFELLHLEAEKTHKKKLQNLRINNSVSPTDPDTIVVSFSSTGNCPRLQSLLAFDLDSALSSLKLININIFLDSKS